MKTKKQKTGFLNIILPGILIAATGVGAGDLATASFTGSQLGVAVLWAVVVGGILKYVLTEGLARWQLVTGTGFLEGVAEKFGRLTGLLFLPYLFLWTFFVGSALMSATGVTLYAIFPIFDSPTTGKIIFGIISSMIGLVLVLSGGFKLFEKIMSISIGIMFVTVVITAVLLWENTGQIISGLLIPTIPKINGPGITWTVALIGGVGGTVTILCYGYWIKEKNRIGENNINITKIDLAVGYLMTVVFGIAMVIIGSSIEIEGKGAGLLISLSDKLNERLGATGKWLFLLGSFSAIFSSLLGVWQAVPYLFADIWNLFIQKNSLDKGSNLTNSKPYKFYLYAIATIPILGLFIGFKDIQKFYSVIGALFLPMTALALLILNGNKKWVGKYKNSILTTLLLIATLIFFGFMAWKQWF